MSRLPGYWTEDTVPQPEPQRPESTVQPRRDDSAVTDFCNERLRELSDLEKVEGLITSLNEQQQTVTAEINQAETQLNQLRQDILAASRTSLSATSVFQSHYNDLTAQISNSWISNYSQHESLIQLQGLDSKRRDLLRARSYLQILLSVYDLSAEVQEQITRDPREATKTYLLLSNLSKDLSERNEKAWGSAVHLTEFLEITVKQLWEEMEKALSQDMKVALKKLNWPNEIKPSSSTLHDLNLLKAAFERLSVFQDLPEFSSGPSSAKATVPSLLPFRIMAQDVDIRFRYHFESNRPTNNIEKPEWFFQSILSTIELHSDFMQNDLQSILNETGFNRIAITEFIAALHPILERKINHILPELLGNSSLLSHFVHEALSFDRKVREEYLFVPYGRDSWEGITAYALRSASTFNAWQKAEKDFAESRYNEILSAKDASEIEYEAVDTLDVKPTKGAMRIMDLIVSFTDRFRGLSSLQGRIQFVLEVQIAILNLYHSKWKSNLEKFELSHPFALAGELREDRKKQAGKVGLERICRVYGSAAWIEDHLKDWTDEMFLQIYAEIIECVRSKKSIGGYSVNDLASQLSESISSGSDNGTVFDVPIFKFRSLREKSVRLIQSHLKREIFEEIRPYTNLLHWSSLGTEDGEEFSVPTHQNSRELLNALPLIESMLSFLHKTLPRQTFLRIFKTFSNEIQAHLWEWMITAHRFSTPGGLLFARDMYAFWEVCSSVVPQPEQYMKRLHDAVVLLSLPSSVRSAPVSGEITLASVTKRLRDTDENDLPRITELKDWLADNLGVKTLSLAELLYM